MGNPDIYNLSRFIEAQDSCEAFETAIEELKVGRKRSHWVWFVFPQLKGLGHSYNSKYYGIGSIDEAKAYLDDDVLRKRLVAVCMELMSQVEDHGLTARRVLGGMNLTDVNPFKSRSESMKPAMDSVSVSDSILVEKFQCKVSQGACSYSGVLNADSIPDGVGEAWFTDGRYYKGNVENGKMVAKDAFFRYPNGDTYQGSFANDHFSEGKYTIAEDGSYFIGTYTDQGQPKKGAWCDKNGQLIENV